MAAAGAVGAVGVRDDLEAPRALFESYHRLYGFTLDVAANHRNAMCRTYFDKEADGLTQSWRGHIVWLHPPQSDVGPWMRKARREAHRGCTVVALVPAMTATDWWHDDVTPYASVRFLRGVPQFRLTRIPVVPRSLPTEQFAVVVYRPGVTLHAHH